ncbi:MAG: AAA-like domain-containing protein [Cyanobacteria bacterium P01_H01_bin.15]
MTMLSFPDLTEFLNDQLSATDARLLSNVETAILDAVWREKTYSQVAEEYNYSQHYLANVAAPLLWSRLKELTALPITKRNCRRLLDEFYSQQTSDQSGDLNLPALPELKSASNVEPTVLLADVPTYPTGALSQDSSYYITRSFLEEQVCSEISKPGSLVRIKGPRDVGKSSLVLRVLDFAQSQNFRTVTLNLEQVDQEILCDRTKFLRWLCAAVSIALNIEPKLDDYWDEDVGSKVSCTLYFRGYLLPKLDQPLVLALDEVNELFEHEAVAKEVLPLLRSWYEEARRVEIWQKFRLIAIHSTEIYVTLDLNQSPFNVGLPVILQPFSLVEMRELAQRYHLTWSNTDPIAEQLQGLLDGHPGLVHLTIYHLSCRLVEFDELFDEDHLETGIFGHHLRRHRAVLRQQPELEAALTKVMSLDEPTRLSSMEIYQLTSMGLVKPASRGKVVPTCELYRRYFGKSRRPRGVVLTEQGWQKLKAAKLEREWDVYKNDRSFTHEELAEITGLAVDTIMRVLGRETKVDKSTLRQFFEAFELVFEPQDYHYPGSN